MISSSIRAKAAQGLWQLADEFQSQGNIMQAVKCLEAICQSEVRFPPLVESKTRMKLACLLLDFSDNVKAAQSHLERSLVVLKLLPGSLNLKCSTISLLSHCYALSNISTSEKQLLMRGLHLAQANLTDEVGVVWMSIFTLQLAKFQVMEMDIPAAISTLREGKLLGQKSNHIGLQLLFATSILQIFIVTSSSSASIISAINECKSLESSFSDESRIDFHGLLMYGKFLQATWHVSICDHTMATAMADSLTHALSDSPETGGSLSSAIKTKDGRLVIAPKPLDATWLPIPAITILVDFLLISCWRAVGKHREAMDRLKKTLKTINEQLSKLGVSGATTEAECSLQSMEDVHLYISFHFVALEHSIAVSLIRTNYREAQQGLVEMVKMGERFPQSVKAQLPRVHVLIGHYLHCLGNFQEAISHFLAAKEAYGGGELAGMCDVFAALSFIAIGTPHSLSSALDHLNPSCAVLNSAGNERTKIACLLGMGLLRFHQNNYADARIRLASGLRMSHQYFGGHNLLAQFLVPLGCLSLRTNDLLQAKEILRSAITTAKVAGNIPLLLAGTKEMQEVYRLTGEAGSVLEAQAYAQKKSGQLAAARKLSLENPCHRHLIQFGL